MNSNINEQGLKNIYWKNFEKTGKINDFLAYVNHKGFENGKSENSGFNNQNHPPRGLQ
jgi:hypothetical protein